MDGYAEILKAYLDDREPTLDVAEALATGRPYQNKRQVHVFSDDLAPWLSRWEQSHRSIPASQEYRVAYRARTTSDIDRFLLGIGAKRVPLQPVGSAQAAIRQAWRLE